MRETSSWAQSCCAAARRGQGSWSWKPIPWHERKKPHDLNGWTKRWTCCDSATPIDGLSQLTAFHHPQAMLTTDHSAHSISKKHPLAEPCTFQPRHVTCWSVLKIPEGCRNASALTASTFTCAAAVRERCGSFSGSLIFERNVAAPKYFRQRLEISEANFFRFVIVPVFV